MIGAFYIFFQKNFSLEEIDTAIFYLSELETAYTNFRDGNVNCHSFYNAVNRLMECVDTFRMYLENKIINLNLMEHDATELRKEFLEKFISPYFNLLSTFENQKKIIEGLLKNPIWLSDVRERTIEHPIGFLKIPIISIGGYSLKLKSAFKSDRLQSYRRPSIELRLHIYKSTKVTSEMLHSHGFDLFSKVSMQGALIDQQFDLIKCKTHSQIKRKMDQVGVDLQNFNAEAKKGEKILNDLDIEYKVKHNKFNPMETFRFYGNPQIGYQPLLFVQQLHQYRLNPHKYKIADCGAIRLHLSEYPHYILISPDFSHTFCLTLRRPGNAKRTFKPSFLLVDSDSSNRQFEPEFSIQELPKLVDMNFLKATLTAFLDDLDNEVVLNKKQQGNVGSYSLANMLNGLIKSEESDAEMEPLDFIKSLFEKDSIISSIKNETITNSTIFVPLFQKLIIEKIKELFQQQHNEQFDTNNENHWKILMGYLFFSAEPYCRSLEL